MDNSIWLVGLIYNYFLFLFGTILFVGKEYFFSTRNMLYLTRHAFAATTPGHPTGLVAYTSQPTGVRPSASQPSQPQPIGERANGAAARNINNNTSHHRRRQQQQQNHHPAARGVALPWWFRDGRGGFMTTKLCFANAFACSSCWFRSRLDSILVWHLQLVANFR